jgi:hypothetical protein
MRKAKRSSIGTLSGHPSEFYRRLICKIGFHRKGAKSAEDQVFSCRQEERQRKGPAVRTTIDLKAVPAFRLGGKLKKSTLRSLRLCSEPDLKGAHGHRKGNESTPDQKLR